MSGTPRLGNISLMACLALCAACATTTRAMQSEDRTMGGGLEDIPKLTVRGEAELRKPADQLRLQIGVVTESTEAAQAMQRNSSAMQSVVAAIKGVGLEQTEYETGRFSLQPVYSRRPRNADAAWRPQIEGYRVTNTLSIRTGRLELAGELIGAANKAGANSIDSIGFDLGNPRTHRAEAIAAATGNAKSDAALLARAADLRLVRVLSIALDEAGHRPPVPMMASRGVALAEAAAPPISPGEVVVRASVTIVYEIAPATP